MWQVTGCVIRADPYYMTLEPVNDTFHGRSMPIGSGITCGDAISLQGSNWVVTDNDVFGGGVHAISVSITDSNTPTWCVVERVVACSPSQARSILPKFRYGRPSNGIIARNIITGGFGIYRMEGCAGVIMEDNTMRGGGLNTYGSWVSTYYSKATEGSGSARDRTSQVIEANLTPATAGLYFARNDVSTIMGGDRELFSFDGGGGAYNGTVAATSPDGCTLTLSADPVYSGYIPPGPRLWNYTGAAVVVLEGTGAGQVRRVVSNDWLPPLGTNKSWVIDRAFDVALDSTSYTSIVPFRGNVIVTGEVM